MIGSRLFSWSLQQIGHRTLLSLMLLSLALFGVLIGLDSVIRRFEPGLAGPGLGVGLLLGWRLAHQPPRRAGLIAGIGGGLFTGLNLLRWQPPSALLEALGRWLLALGRGQPQFEPTAAMMMWGLALWLVAFWAGRATRTGRPLAGLAPAGTVLAITLSYGPNQVPALILFLVATLLLTGLNAHYRREQQWQATGLDFALDIRIEITLAIVAISFSLTMLAHLGTGLSLPPVLLPLQRILLEETLPFAAAFGLKGGERPASLFHTVRQGGLPRDHLPGSGPELSERAVMLIRADSPSAYWRSLTYDRYINRGWRTGDIETESYRANERLRPEPPRLIHQEIIRLDEGDGLIYAAGELVRVDHRYRAAWRSSQDLFGATTSARRYRAVSSGPIPDPVQLRAAGTAYPAWVRHRYLAPPAGISLRVRQLAHHLTEAEPTPYDRARAIERYLRGYPYTLDLPPPPADRELVDYFLFDLQKGYCDYYATAMVILARLAGLPARLAIGYAGGRYDPDRRGYLITEAEAHAWPEIYFPEIGWVPFEPTAARPVIEWTGQAPPETPPLDWPAEAGRSMPFLWSWLLLPAALLGGWLAFDRWRLGRLEPQAAIITLYRRLRKYGPRLGLPDQAGATPYEFVHSLTERLAPQWQSGWLAVAPDEAYRLTAWYVRAAYSPHRLIPAERRQAIRLWGRLRWRLGWLWLRLRLSLLASAVNIRYTCQIWREKK